MTTTQDIRDLFALRSPIELGKQIYYMKTARQLERNILESNTVVGSNRKMQCQAKTYIKP